MHVHMADSLCLCMYVCVFPLSRALGLGSVLHVLLVCFFFPPRFFFFRLLIIRVKRFPYVRPGCQASAILIMVWAGEMAETSPS